MSIHQHSFPNESADYRVSRNKLLLAEMELREKIEEVAALRRQLPSGGQIKEDYIFEELELTSGEVKTRRFSELFNGKANLIMYSYMFGDTWENPCPSCTAVIDGFNGYSHHVRQQVELVVTAKASCEKLFKLAKGRGWNNIRLVSDKKNTYHQDYLAQFGSEEKLIPMLNVFVNQDSEVRHFWATEMVFCSKEGQHPRHVDLIWPLWNLLDMTPQGRGNDWLPKVTY